MLHRHWRRAAPPWPSVAITAGTTGIFPPIWAETAWTDTWNEVLLDIWRHYGKTALFVTHSIREAVLLADRVLVMTRRPATVVADVRIPFDRPRDISVGETPEFARLCRELRGMIEHGGGTRDRRPGDGPVLQPGRHGGQE